MDVTLPSGEFDPGIGDRPYPGGTAVFNGQLWLVGCGNSSGEMFQTTFDLALLSSADGLTDQKNWLSTKLSVPQGASTLARCSLTPGPTELYLVWSGLTVGDGLQYEAKLLCSAYSLSSSPPAWGTPVQLQDQAGKAVTPSLVVQLEPPPPTPSHMSDAAATVFGEDSAGNDILIVGCIITPATGQSQLYLGTYNRAQVDATANVWPATSSTTLTASEIWPTFPNLDNVGNTLTLDYFPSASADTTGDPLFSLVASLAFDVPGQKGQVTNAIAAVLPLTADGTIGPIPANGGFLLNDDPPVPLCCLRNPAAQPQAYWPTPGQSVSVRTYALSQVQPDNPNLPPVGTDDVFPAKSANDIAMSVAFLVDTAATTVENTEMGTASSCPIYRFVFYGSPVKGQVQQFGIARILSPQSLYRPAKTYNIVTGIIDGPVPTPNENLVPGTTGPSLGTVVYSSTATEQVTHQRSCAWTVGIQDSFQTTKGVGPAWNISVSSGAGWVSGSTTELVLSSSQSNPVELDPTSGDVLPNAAAFCYAVEFAVIGYQVLTPDGDPISDPTQAGSDAGPQMVVIQTNLVDPPPQIYVPFSVTPGDLSSYTPESWNATMQNLGYSGQNYFGDVIAANAYKFSNGEPYILMGWGQGATDTQSYLATASSFTETSWTFNSSVYAGVTFGGGFALFDMGEEASGTFMAGMTFAAEAQTSETSSDQWGVAVLPSTFGPPPLPQVDAAMAGYSFRLYFLPPPSPPLEATYWADELRMYLPKNPPGATLDPASIDPESAPWRIVFVVTYYESNDKSAYYVYDGLLDP